MTKSRGILPKRVPWQPWQLEALRVFYPHWRSDWIARALGRTTRQVYQAAYGLGLHKTDAYLASPDAHRLDGLKGSGTRFPKGNVPHNAGRRGHPSWSPATTFRTGNRPHNWTPVGTCVPTPEGYLKVKLREPNVWGRLHELVWASVHEWPRPKGFVIAFRDGDKQNCDPGNLVLLSRADNMQRNTIHRYPQPIKQLIRARASLVRKIHDHEQDRGRTQRAVRADGAAGEGGEPGGRDRAVEGDG